MEPAIKSKKYSVRSISGAKVNRMNDHVKLAFRKNTDYFIIHTGIDVTNKKSYRKLYTKPKNQA